MPSGHLGNKGNVDTFMADEAPCPRTCRTSHWSSAAPMGKHVLASMAPSPKLYAALPTPDEELREGFLRGRRGNARQGSGGTRSHRKAE